MALLVRLTVLLVLAAVVVFALDPGMAVMALSYM